MDTASRLYDLTGDRALLLSPVMENFFGIMKLFSAEMQIFLLQIDDF